MVQLALTVPAGGDAVSRWQHAISFDTSLSNEEVWPETTNSSRTLVQDWTMKPITRGRTVYAWGRYINTKGATSPWSPRVSTVASSVPADPPPPSISNITQRTFTVNSIPKAGEVAPILEYWYILHRQEAGGFVKLGDYNYTTPSKDFFGLTPATDYAMTVKFRNATGWSSLSKYTFFTTTAGAEVFLSSRGWVKAVPYVRVNGVWKMALPYARTGGVWKASLE